MINTTVHLTAILDFIVANVLQPDALPATNSLSARLVEHVEEHGESIVMPDNAGHVNY
jgi:hypothetical protein